MVEAPGFVKRPNPQGKGLVPVLRDWQLLSPVVQEAKSAPEFLRDYCLSLLVLASDFPFRPVIGRHYYLYFAAAQWKLSMIAPQMAG